MAFEARFHIIAVVMLEDGFPIPCVSFPAARSLICVVRL